MVHYIYSLSHPLTNEVRYIGKTINIKRRYKQHLYDNRVKSHKGSWIQSLKSQGLKPIMEIIEECTDQNWEDREKYWIEKFDNLTNMKKGGNGGDDYKRYVSEESIEKIRQANLGKVFSKEHRDKIGNSMPSRKINIDGIEYKSVMHASRMLNIKKSTVFFRVNSKNFPTYFYVS
jgi:group I intron endonuclease